MASSEPFYTGVREKFGFLILITCARTAGNRFEKPKFQVASVYKGIHLWKNKMWLLMCPI